MTTAGCSRTTDPLPKTTAAASSSDQTHTGLGALTSDKTINTFTQPENPRFSKEVRRIYSNGVRNTATYPVWLATVWLILITFVMK